MKNPSNNHNEKNRDEKNIYEPKYITMYCLMCNQKAFLKEHNSLSPYICESCVMAHIQNSCSNY